MAPSIPRPTTPPQYLPLTPPPTGGNDERIPFLEPLAATHVNKRQTRTEEEEPLVESFKDSNEGSDTEIDSNDDLVNSSFTRSDNSSQPLGESLTAGTSISTASATSASAFVGVSELLSSCVVPSEVCVVHAHFALLKLPLSARNRVYEHLLTIPAIICVRQKHTAYHDDRKAFLYAERRELLPGIAYALTQTKVDGPKSRLSRFPGTNLNILRTSKEVFTEARSVMYSLNSFEIVKPSNELTPKPDFSVPLFPSGYQRLITRLVIRIRTFYDLDWLLSGGYNVLKNYYRGLQTLTLVLEMDCAIKGFGRQWGRKSDERWRGYIKRLHFALAKALFGETERRKAATIATWIDLRVLFAGETYADTSRGSGDVAGIAMTGCMQNEWDKREELRNALVQAWELFKKGGK